METRKGSVADIGDKQLDARAEAIAARIAAARYVRGACFDRWPDWTDAERKVLRAQVRGNLFEFEEAGFEVVNAESVGAS